MWNGSQSEMNAVDRAAAPCTPAMRDLKTSEEYPMVRCVTNALELKMSLPRLLLVWFLLPLQAGCIVIGNPSYKTVRVKVISAEARPEYAIEGAIVRVSVEHLEQIEINRPKPDLQFTDHNGEARLKVAKGGQPLMWEVFAPGYCGFQTLETTSPEEPPEEKVFRLFGCGQDVRKKSQEANRDTP